MTDADNCDENTDDICVYDDLYFEFKPYSKNGGEVDYDALIKGNSQPQNEDGSKLFNLYRIGDAVANRNIHAAVYDALRLVKDI